MGKKVIIAFDGIQYFDAIKDFDIVKSISSIRFRNVSFIFSGSEVGVNRLFLNEESPLHDRVSEIQLKPFDERTAIDYLEDGFLQYNIIFRNADKIYEELGGNPGWLTGYGIEIMNGEFQDALKKVKEIAKDLLRKELESFLDGKKEKDVYLKVLKTCKDGCTLDDVAQTLSKIKGKEVEKENTQKIINELERFSLLIKDDKNNKKYILGDKILKDII